MMIGTQEHYDLMAAFERDHRGYRLDRETKDLWPKGHVYQNGETNALFLAYRNGAAFAKAYHRDESSTPANPAQVTDALQSPFGVLTEELDGERAISAIESLNRAGWIITRTSDAIGAGGQAVAGIVPEGCTDSAIAFDPGVLHVNKDGSGYIAVDEDAWQLEDDRCEGVDGPEGSVHWITRLDASEMQALRDFLNGVPLTQPAPSGQAVAVKPLEWHQSHTGMPGDAHTVPTLYTVRFVDDRDGWRWMGLGGHGYEITSEAAKAAAQADYERRILSCLAAPVPATDTARPLNSGEVEALREALDFVNETSGAALGLAMSGDNHPNPDGVLMDISRKGMDLAPRLFAALSSAPSTPEGWRDMASAPTDGSRVICWNSEWETPESGCLYGFVWAANSLAANKGGWKYQPTNWMPLPTPPAGGGDE